MEIEWEEGKFHVALLNLFKKFLTDYPMFSKTMSWYISLGCIFSMVIYSISWDSDSQLEYLLSLVFFSPIFYSIPVITFLISYKSFNKEYKLLSGFFSSVILSLIGLFLFKLIISLGFSAGLEAVSSQDDNDDAEFFDTEGWGEITREWVLPSFTAGLGCFMFVLHSSITKPKTKSNKSKSQKTKRRSLVPDINQVGRLSPDGYEWIDMPDGTQWFRTQNSRIPYERYNPKR